MEINSRIETLALTLYNSASCRSSKTAEVRFPSTHRDFESIYFSPGLQPGSDRTVKFNYKKISYKDQVFHRYYSIN